MGLLFLCSQPLQSLMTAPKQCKLRKPFTNKMYMYMYVLLLGSTTVMLAYLNITSEDKINAHCTPSAQHVAVLA